MSKKEYVKNVRTPLWGGYGYSIFSIKYYGSFWGNMYSYSSALHKLLAKGLNLKVTKAPTKRRLKKDLFMFSSVPIAYKYKKFVVNPLLSMFPRKGLSAKYIPYVLAKKKKSFTNKKYKFYKI